MKFKEMIFILTANKCFFLRDRLPPQQSYADKPNIIFTLHLAARQSI